ncbi:hypothetical protein [Flavobacterium sp. GNP001]
MNPSHYYLEANNALQTKNKLQAEFARYLQSISSKLIDAEQLPELKKEILEKQIELNTKYPRCTPLNISFYNPGGNHKLIISGFYGVTFSINDAYYDNN